MNSVRTRLRRRLVRVVAVAVLPAASLAFCSAPLTAQASRPAEPSGCQLNSAGGTIKHVIQLQFDNVHFRRDNPNVPSDIEQMPNLYNFLLGNGTVLNNHHTQRISHAVTYILSTLTGVYPDRHGQPVSSAFMFYGGDGIAHTALSFAYWTDLAQAFDGTAEGKYNLVDAQGNNPPAPWVPYTRAGCNFGAVGTANIELERVANVATVYGATSPEAAEAADTSDNGVAKTTADFIGVAIHCAQAAALCASSNRAVADVLPGDPIYEQNLRNYDEAFDKFFARLAADGINKSNTLFIVTADENDHFVGVGPSNPGCNGVVVTCTYNPTKLGSVEVALDTLLGS